ncbi:receptor protein-tyrosine kinase [Sarracenia purpurea var. burkii]
MPRTVGKPAGNTVRLKCLAGGNPPLNFNWLKDGFPPIRSLGAREFECPTLSDNEPFIKWIKPYNVTEGGEKLPEGILLQVEVMPIGIGIPQGKFLTDVTKYFVFNSIKASRNPKRSTEK